MQRTEANEWCDSDAINRPPRQDGKEIYEGDVLASYEGEEIGWLQAGKVFWWDDEAKFILADREGYSAEDDSWDTPSNWEEYEVIGNIYENRELLRDQT